jgi:hypothetical protein
MRGGAWELFPRSGGPFEQQSDARASTQDSAFGPFVQRKEMIAIGRQKQLRSASHKRTTGVEQI